MATTMAKYKQRGVTVVELVAVLVVISIITVSAVSRGVATQTFQLQASHNEFVAAATLAQQLAMARDANISLVTTSNNVNVLIDSTPASIGSVSFPKSLPSGYSVSPATTLSYDKLGQTAATEFTITSSDGGTITVSVEASGYAH